MRRILRFVALLPVLLAGTASAADIRANLDQLEPKVIAP
jgi:hypothetical protein